MDSINSGLNELLKVLAAAAITILTAYVRAWIKKELERRNLEAASQAAYDLVVAVEKQIKGKGKGSEKLNRVWAVLEQLFPSINADLLQAKIETAHNEADLEHPKEVVAT